MSPRYSRLLAAVVLALAAVGCTATMRDYFHRKPLAPIPLHQGMEAKEQCLHCHIAAIAGAPPVPHPDRKRCTLCHTTTAAH